MDSFRLKEPKTKTQIGFKTWNMCNGYSINVKQLKYFYLPNEAAAVVSEFTNDKHKKSS